MAVWASSGLTFPGEQAALNQNLYRSLFGGDRSTTGESLTLGEAAVRAKAAVNDGDLRRTWILLGDPTMRLDIGSRP